MMRKIKPSKLLDANTAVESYLDTLLQEATEVQDTDASMQLDVAEKKSNVHVLETALRVEKPVDVIADIIPELAKDTGVEKELEETLEPERKGMESLRFPIQCLMFKVKNHLLSMPLIQMGSVLPWHGNLTQLPRSPSYFKGLLKYRDRNIKVADTASLLMNVMQGKAVDDAFLPSHLLVFESEDWAISCDELQGVVTLNEDDIKWHADSQTRLSYGTIKTSLALILNPDAMTAKLLKNDGSLS